MRFKTEKEFINEYGVCWKVYKRKEDKSPCTWVDGMNILFGQPVNEYISREGIESLRSGVRTNILATEKINPYQIDPYMVIDPNHVILKRLI